MPRAPLSPEEIAAFRQRIAAVASKLFVEHGYEGVTMRAVASALDVSAMALYRYVDDKQALLTLVRTYAYRAFADQQERAFAASPDPREQLRELGKAYLTFALAHPDWYRIMFELDQPQGTSTELEREVKRSFSYLLRAVEQAIASGAQAGDPLTVAHVTWATVHGIVSLHLAGKLTMGRDIGSLMEQLIGPAPKPAKKSAHKAAKRR